MTKIQEKTKQNQSVFWILVHKALDKNDGQIFCLPVALSKYYMRLATKNSTFKSHKKLPGFFSSKNLHWI